MSVISNYLASDSNPGGKRDKVKKRSKLLILLNSFVDVSLCSINELRKGYTDFFKKGRDLGSPIPANEILFSFQMQQKKSSLNQRRSSSGNTAIQNSP